MGLDFTVTAALPQGGRKSAIPPVEWGRPERNPGRADRLVVKQGSPFMPDHRVFAVPTAFA
jgi:hypothetical protein